jgi:hypothetical protein
MGWRRGRGAICALLDSELPIDIRHTYREAICGLRLHGRCRILQATFPPLRLSGAKACKRFVRVNFRRCKQLAQPQPSHSHKLGQDAIPATNVEVTAREAGLGISLKFQQTSRPAYDEKLVWDWCNTTARGQRGLRGKSGIQKAHDLAARSALCGQTRCRRNSLGGNQAGMSKQYSGQSWRLPRPGVSARGGPDLISASGPAAKPEGWAARFAAHFWK